MSSKRQFDFTIGDRVAERPKTHALFATRPESMQRIKQYRTQRYGYVVEIKEKPDASGRRRKVVMIQWDHLTSPTEHATMRICPASEIDRLTKAVIVPGE